MIEVLGKEIASGKIVVKQVFDEDMWYRIPDYQRPYVWGDEEVFELLNDIYDTASTNQNTQYFLGSIVLHSRPANQKENSVTYQENDLLDGQQRLTTLYLIFAVIRDLTSDPRRKVTCAKSIFQEANPDDNIPERLRITFPIRTKVQDFIDQFVKAEGGTTHESRLRSEAEQNTDLSVRNLSNAILKIRSWFKEKGQAGIDLFFPFLRNKVLLIYVASQELDDAFRLFTVLNDRGIRLRNSDILKAENLRALKNNAQRTQYARIWEEMEGELGEDFDQFLSYIRTILLKEKARLGLLKEFEENIYNPRQYDSRDNTYKQLEPKLTKGEATFEFIKKFKNHYDAIFSGRNYLLNHDYSFDNLITVLSEAALSDIWIPPLLAYREAFGEYRISEFLIRLDNKFSGDWIARETPTTRIESMNSIVKKIEAASAKTNDNHDSHKADKLLISDVFEFNRKEFHRHLKEGPVYSKRYAKYILRKLDYLFGSPSERRPSQREISIEHILPQNPERDSQWCKDFTSDERQLWTDRIGNLVLITGRKNSSQGRSDFQKKKTKYFKNNIETFPNSLRIMKNFDQWTMKELEKNTGIILKKLLDHYEK